MHAALNAHEAAHGLHILHRDISPGNILIFGPDEFNESSKGEYESKIDGGLLIDWDLSKYFDPKKEQIGPHQYTRTGTWQFMAADLVERPNTHQTFVHDLESFFLVLLWTVLTEVQTGWTDGHRSSFTGTINPKIYSDWGGPAKTTFLISSIAVSETEFQIPKNPTFADLCVDCTS